MLQLAIQRRAFQRPILNGVKFHKIGKEAYLQLIVPFSEEVKEDVLGCDGNKIPGAGGFNINFIKTCW